MLFAESLRRHALLWIYFFNFLLIQSTSKSGLFSDDKNIDKLIFKMITE
ncbi:hypothetical protein [Methylomonas albis]|nr:hypothetical protein [Methylomonas albis]